jgi:hypothetical protein
VASANVTSSTADPNTAPNNASSATIQVSNAPPVIAANGSLDMTIECATSFTDPGATATDMCQGPVPVTSSSTVNVGAVGNYAVTYNAADAAGGQATPVVRSVHVADTIAPVVTVLGPNPATVECATPFVDPGATAADSCVGPVAVTTSGAVSTGVPGSYTLGYAATDPSGNTGMASRLVNVNDTIPPTITVKGPFVLAPPNHKYKTFTVAELVSKVTDSCVPGLGIADAVITRVSSDEPEDGIGRGLPVHPAARRAQRGRQRARLHDLAPRPGPGGQSDRGDRQGAGADQHLHRRHRRGRRSPVHGAQHLPLTVAAPAHSAWS